MDDQNKDALLKSEQDNDSLENKQDQENNTDPSEQLTPDHPRFKQVIEERNELREKLTALEAQVQERQTRTGDDTTTPEEQEAYEKIEKEMKKRGFVSESILNRQNELARLETARNGADGTPKFVAIDVIEFAKKQGYGENYEAAYNAMHHDALVQVEARRYAQERGVPISEPPTGGEKSSPLKQFTPEEIANMPPEEYEKHRSELLTAIKPPKRNQ